MFKKILVPIDMQQSEQSAALLKVADKLVEEFGSDVHVMTVMPGYGMPIVATYFPPDAMKKARTELESKLEKFVSGHLNSDAVTSVSEGKRAQEILKTADQENVDLILLGCHSHGKLEDALLGSCGTKVAQHASCSVMVVRD
jgi:nucleotide-binding universal stress UspA family protein